MLYNRLRNLNKKVPRRLDISSGGKWFLLLTIALGAVAINSNNNVIYLLESLLLSSLLFSGILSDYSLSKVHVSRRLNQALATHETKDSITLVNTGVFPLFCVEVGEWKSGRFIQVGYVLQIPAKSKVQILAHQVFPRRGYHEWEHLAVATSFPFGFAKKIRFIDDGGKRIIWPRMAKSLWQGDPIREIETLEGEIRNIPEGSDVSKVHWLSSARSDQLMERPNVVTEEQLELSLNIIEANSASWEKKIEEASFHIHRGRADQVKIKAPKNSNYRSRTIVGRRASLDGLALLPGSDEKENA